MGKQFNSISIGSGEIGEKDGFCDTRCFLLFNGRQTNPYLKACNAGQAAKVMILVPCHRTMPVKGTRQTATVELDYVTNNASSVRLRATLALLSRVMGEVSIVSRTSELMSCCSMTRPRENT